MRLRFLLCQFPAGNCKICPMIVHLTPRKGKQNCVSDVSVFEERGGGEFKINAADIFSFDPIPTRAKKAWSSSTCLLYGLWSVYTNL